MAPNMMEEKSYNFRTINSFLDCHENDHLGKSAYYHKDAIMFQLSGEYNIDEIHVDGIARIEEN
jgi:hypothetical protein